MIFKPHRLFNRGEHENAEKTQSIGNPLRKLCELLFSAVKRNKSYVFYVSTWYLCGSKKIAC